MSVSKKIGLRIIRTKFALLSRVSKQKAAQQAFALFTSPQSRVKKVPPAIFKQAHKADFNYDGLLIRGFRFNTNASKKVLILHGYESSIVNFDVYVKPLIDKGYEVLMFDAPAHGGSGGVQINAIDYKNFILHLIKTFGPITSFITHSFGGLGLSLALEEIPHNEKWKVVFVAPATESVTAINHFLKLLKLDKEVRKNFDALITAANNKPPEWYSLARAAKHIKAQVLFLQDKNDTLTPLSDVEPLMAKQYPNFEFIISEGLGHRRIYRDEGSVDAIIRFL